MPKLKRPAFLSAAECARRTGLTVRALRIYERHGLIKPARSGKGWRLYGPSELQRLNIIVTLKTFGMTLAQIRSLLKTSPPPLEGVLEMQIRACRARRDAAEKALGLVQAALATIESGRPLALEELCNLTRSMEMGNHHAIARKLINEQITPQEERAYMTWMSARSPGEIKAMQEYGAAMRALFRSLQDLRSSKSYLRPESCRWPLAVNNKSGHERGVLRPPSLSTLIKRPRLNRRRTRSPRNSIACSVRH
jgi:DNA-binding transcriptional MerR regulator